MPPQPESAYSSARVRREFIEHFTRKDHREVPSGPVFPQDDPTLLFTNAGMNQFKDVFLGTGTRDYVRAVDTQKCIRASGKHNDLEDVGRDSYHHTFFEMLGNWSFGDYFKEEAIVWAWELLTGVWKLPKDRLWVTVFGGDAEDGTGPDEEAERIWRERTDIDPAHVLRCDKADNFWEMGATGPCGPCSEIHIDRGGPGSDPADGADPAIGVNAGNERFIELWNLVFMEFKRQEDGKLVELAVKSIDTGMGFERILAVLQGQNSNYDTDLFAPIFARITELTGERYGGGDEETDVAFRVCADHVRAVSVAVADGALPSNEGRGYVLRRLIRRASRFGRQRLGVEEPFLHALVPTVAEILGEAFPELRQRVEHVQLIVKSEEESFRKTLDRGLGLFEKVAERVAGEHSDVIPGESAFELYATYGFPRDLVELMARERGMSVDEQGWDAAEAAHRAVSKSEGMFKQALSADELTGLQPTISTYHEADERNHELETEVLLLAEGGDTEDGRRSVRIVLRESPFYAESGGQVGDTGVIEAADGSLTLPVTDTQRMGGIVIHTADLGGAGPDALAALGPGARVRARVDTDRRDRTRRHHTATHLLHKALRVVLGDHVAQQGSYVGPDRLRFDFSQPKGVTQAELERVEAIVSERVFANAPVVTTIEDLDEARARGVVAMFGEKYDQRVRVLDVGGWSIELCGGTHVGAAGDIGPFVILSERAISAGVRRIEAVTGRAAVDEIQRQRRILRAAAQGLKTAPDELPARIDQLQKQLKAARKEQRASAGADLAASFQKVKAGLADRGGTLTGVLDCPELDAKTLREMGERLKSLSPDLAVAVFGRDGDRVPFLIVCQGAAQAKGLRAGALAKGIAGLLGGGGGGRPDLAQGQGTKPEAIPAALECVERELALALDG